MELRSIEPFSVWVVVFPTDYVQPIPGDGDQRIQPVSEITGFDNGIPSPGSEIQTIQILQKCKQFGVQGTDQRKHTQKKQWYHPATHMTIS